MPKFKKYEPVYLSLEGRTTLGFILNGPSEMFGGTYYHVSVSDRCPPQFSMTGFGSFLCKEELLSPVMSEPSPQIKKALDNYFGRKV